MPVARQLKNTAMKVLILGGYGNFGKRLVRILAPQGISVVIAGRNWAKAAEFAKSLPPRLVEIATFDAEAELPQQLGSLRPDVVVNASGPFQGAGYGIARACIEAGVSYIDLADGRDFVRDIVQLDADARTRNVAVVSGASTVPALTSAVVEQLQPRFGEIESLTFGIAPGQLTERGLATTQAILGYVGKRLKPCAGYPKRYGWQDLYRADYPIIGKRWMANCDVPDLDLLPAKYGIEKICFSAGMENSVVHFGLWLLSWTVRLGLPINLAAHAPAMLKASNWFDFIGTPDGGMHVILQGKDKAGAKLAVRWFMIATDADGPYIPAVPAAVLVKRLAAGKPLAPGAMPCVGLVSLKDYLDELKPFRIKTYQFEDHQA